jgi:hypothetical protein
VATVVLHSSPSSPTSVMCELDSVVKHF